jgi:hypothetical protein
MLGYNINPFAAERGCNEYICLTSNRIDSEDV